MSDSHSPPTAWPNETGKARETHPIQSGSDQETVARKRSWLFWATAVVTSWTVVGLWSANRYILWNYLRGSTIQSWRETLFLNLFDVWVWAAYTPGIMWITRHFPFEKGRTARTLAIHTISALGFLVVDAGIGIWATPLLTGRAAPSFGLSLVVQANVAVFSYGAVVAVILAIDYYGAFRSRELKAARLQGELTRAKLQLLKGQLQPHFLFNTLNAISALMHSDVEMADRVLVRLSELLRIAIDGDSTQEVPLSQEISFLEGYLEIVTTRFPDRIRTHIDVPIDTADALVPILILQPLVENAVRHAIAPSAGAGRIEIRAQRNNGLLRLSVCDDGPGLTVDPAQVFAKGVGLSNTRERLRHLYGEEGRFAIERGALGGFAVEVIIPYSPGVR